MFNLYDILLENYTAEQLIEEGKDPKEVLKYKFSQVPEQVIDLIISIDPTKKKSYSQWLLGKWDNERDNILKNLGNGRIEKLFNYFKEHNDIQLKDFPTVDKALLFIPMEDNDVLHKSDKEMTFLINLDREVPSDEANDFDIVFDEDDWVIAVPNTFYADCKLGENTEWCTAGVYGNHDDSYYNKYLEEGGKYYVNFDKRETERLGGKDYPYKRYQFHFESSQFMNSKDNSVGLDEINIPESAIEFYSNEGYDAEDFEDLDAKIERYSEQRYQDAIPLTHDENGDYTLYLNVEYNDDYHYEEPTENSDYYVFDYDRDDRDPLCWEEFSPNLEETIVENREEDGFLILSPKRNPDSFCIFYLEYRGRWSSHWEHLTNSDFYKILSNNILITKERYNRGRLTIAYNGIGVNVNTYKDNIADAFINETIEDDNAIWLEIVYDDGFHSLIELSMDGGDTSNRTVSKRVFIYNDIPINGKFFECDKEGNVQAVYRSYELFVFGIDNESEDSWHLDYELENGDYLVRYDVGSTDGVNNDYNVHNIISRETKKPILKRNFQELISYDENYYVIKFNRDNIGNNNVSLLNKMIVSRNGQPIVDKCYGAICPLDDSRKYFALLDDEYHYANTHVDILNLVMGDIQASFEGINTSFGRHNGIISVLNKNRNYLLYNYIENKVLSKEFTELHALGKNTCYFTDENYNTKIAIIDNLKVINDDVQKIDMARRSDEDVYWRMSFSDNSINVFSKNKERFILPTNAEQVVFSGNYNIVIYTLNGYCYFYNLLEEQFLKNISKVDCNRYEIFADYYGHFCILDINTQAEIFYNYDEQKVDKYSNHKIGDSFYALKIGIGTMSDDVKRIITDLTTQNVDEVKNSFNSFLKRLNEANRHFHKDYLK